jgi:hypothetical protein
MFASEQCSNSGAALATQCVNAADLAERALRSSPYLVLRNVACQHHDGVLTLRGCLPSYYLKQVAQAVVAPIEGVRLVVNEIQVGCATNGAPSVSC